MKYLNILIITALCVLINACKKTDSNDNQDPGKATYSVRMTDAPGPYQEVNIDVQGVEITGSAGKTDLLNVNAGIYNLLDFADGRHVNAVRLLAKSTSDDSKLTIYLSK